MVDENTTGTCLRQYSIVVPGAALAVRTDILVYGLVWMDVWVHRCVAVEEMERRCTPWLRSAIKILQDCDQDMVNDSGLCDGCC